MSRKLTDLHPVSRITIGAVGPPGQRVFLLQASHQSSTITLKLEKEQARILASSTIELLDELDDKYPRRGSKIEHPLSSDLMLHDPVDPEFIIGQIGLGYDQDEDMVVLVVQEAQFEPEQEHEPITVRLWASRTQMRAMCDHTLEVVEQGRPLCPLCEAPMDPAGHFCPKTNGYERVKWV